MAVPTIASVSPTSGPTRGDMLIEIVGTNFRVPTIPAAGTGPTSGVLIQTVRVTLGSTVAPLVDVFSSTLLSVRIPASDAGVVAIKVENLDDNGVLIPGETVTLAAAFTYARPLLTAEYESDFARVIRVLLRRLKQQTLAKEIHTAVETDYDEATGDALNVTKIGAFPSIALVGPELRENRFYSVNEQPTIALDTNADGQPDEFWEMRVPYTVDILFTLVGMSNNQLEAMNLMANVVAFFHRNKTLAMDRIKDDPAKGSVAFEMDFEPGGQPKMGGAPNNSNVHQFSASFAIRGFDIEDLSGIAIGYEPGTNIPRFSIIREGRTALTITTSPAERVPGS